MSEATATPGGTSRFEQVDEPADDALTLTLKKESADKNFGTIVCPAAVTQGRLPKGFTSGELPLKEAFRTAVRLANDYKTPMVVIDPDGLWQAEWGVLYRYEDEPEAG